ncbi:hypothetical protein C8Q74DRAFT_1218311 [Fomes fomentarius]|nr:hypothetical protein C8Q74DRAFT_1218311 [Fomes fomentarius]
MSDDLQTDQLVAEYNSLLVYDYVITVGLEMKLFWKRKGMITGSSILFIVNRFPDPTTSKYLPWSRKYSNKINLWLFFSTLRAYALLSSGTRHGWQWYMSTLVLLSSLAPVVINIVGMSYWSVVGTSANGCIITAPHLSKTIQDYIFSFLFTIISRVCLITSDLLVMCITWKATYKMSRDIKVLGQGSSLSNILFRNGIFYFGWGLVNIGLHHTGSILATLNILHLTFTFISHSWLPLALQIIRVTIALRSDPSSIIVSFAEPHEANNAATHQHSQVSSMSSLNFNRVIGSLGSSLPAPGEISEVQSVPQGNDEETEVENLNNGEVSSDGTV